MREEATPKPGRIERCFTALRAKNRKGFIAYICAGDPNLSTTVELSLALAAAGTDIIELGVPFSDPLADGLVNQLAAQRALAAGTTSVGVLKCVQEIRKQSEVPIVLYTYLNPILQFGFERFHAEAADAGVDGLLILDLPPEEEEPPPLDLPHIRLIAPTTSAERLPHIARNAQGFLYYVSREGVTGVQQTMAADLEAQLTRIRHVSSLPIAVGFGISTPQQAQAVARHADAVVVGSAIVRQMAEQNDQPDMVKNVIATVEPLVQAVHGHAT